MKEGARLIPVSEATVVASSSTFVKETESAAEILAAVVTLNIVIWVNNKNHSIRYQSFVFRPK